MSKKLSPLEKAERAVQLSLQNVARAASRFASLPINALPDDARGAALGAVRTASWALTNARKRLAQAKRDASRRGTAPHRRK